MITFPPSEQRVLDGMLRGESTAQIAAATGLTITTVMTYRKRMYARTGVHSMSEFLAFVRRDRNTRLLEELRLRARVQGGSGVYVSLSLWDDVLAALEAP